MPSPFEACKTFDNLMKDSVNGSWRKPLSYDGSTLPKLSPGQESSQWPDTDRGAILLQLRSWWFRTPSSNTGNLRSFVLPYVLAKLDADTSRGRPATSELHRVAPLALLLYARARGLTVNSKLWASAPQKASKQDVRQIGRSSYSVIQRSGGCPQS